MAYPVGMLDAMDHVLRDEDRARKRAQNRAKARRRRG